MGWSYRFNGKIDGGDQFNAITLYGYDPFKKKSGKSNGSEPKLTAQEISR